MISIFTSVLPSFPQVTKATAKFVRWSHSGGWDFDDWNEWRMRDGMMCRTNSDCAWLNGNLLCQDFELEITPSALWFGGDVANIRGKCQCGVGMFWDDDNLQCLTASYSTGILVLFAIFGLIGLGVLCCFCFCIYKMFS